MADKKPTAIIQARMGSTRFPGKIMKLILGKPVLWHVVNRTSLANNLKEIIVATTIEKEDDVIYEFCLEQNIPVFRGSKEDVLDRYYQCAKEYSVDHVVRITSDCPLHDPKVIDRVVQIYLDNNYDYVTNALENTYPDGIDLEVFTFKALEEAWQKSTLKSDREHVTPYIRHQEKFKIRNVTADKNYPPYRLTVDYPEDYEFIKQLYDGIGKEIFYLDDIKEFLDSHPALLEINQHIRPNEGYTISLVEDAKDVMIHGKKTYLIGLNEENLFPQHINWMKNPSFLDFLGIKDSNLNQFKNYLENERRSKDSLLYGIFLIENDIGMGIVKIDIDIPLEKAILNIWVDKAYEDPDLCTETLKILVDYIFTILKLKEVLLKTYVTENISKCAKSLGFKITSPLEDEKAADTEIWLIMKENE
ncbi:MAG TPA: hypothetical protein VK444_00275 [Methanobacteriaceae archaeon]|nr:hypothetical protein [Methanobacteriaceae archaeon]